MPVSVLVTRPAGQAEKLCSALAQAGHSAHHLPLIEIQALPELSPAGRAAVLALDEYRHVILISGNAVQHGMAWIDHYWPQLPVGLNWYAVGAATAAALQACGVTAIAPAIDMSSEGLLALPQLSEVVGERVLIIRGEGGRTTLLQELSRRGALVDELACYRRRCPDYAAGEVAARLRQWRIELAMISSGEGLDNLLTLLSPTETSKFTNIALLLPSARVGDRARAAGFRRVAIAENASDSAMLRALETWQTSAGE
jgi:uroporphyrinogen-III synthase